MHSEEYSGTVRTQEMKAPFAKSLFFFLKLQFRNSREKIKTKDGFAAKVAADRQHRLRSLHLGLAVL